MGKVPLFTIFLNTLSRTAVFLQFLFIEKTFKIFRNINVAISNFQWRN